MDDQIRIFDYLAERNPQGALDMDELFSQKAWQLTVHSKVHKAGRVRNTWKAVIYANYVLVYEAQA